MVNQNLEQYLRMYINYQQDEWSKFLPLSKFSYKNASHCSSKILPFCSLYGRHPHFKILKTQLKAWKAETMSKTLHSSWKTYIQNSKQKFLDTGNSPTAIRYLHPLSALEIGFSWKLETSLPTSQPQSCLKDNYDSFRMNKLWENLLTIYLSLWSGRQFTRSSMSHSSNRSDKQPYQNHKTPYQNLSRSLTTSNGNSSQSSTFDSSTHGLNTLSNRKAIWTTWT